MPFDFNLQTFLQDPQFEGLLRVGLAGLLGVLVGLERQMEGKPAGSRTYGGVAMGAALFTFIGIVAFSNIGTASQIGAGVVTGVGFLGAGTILHLRGQVVGLTTATGMWAIAAVGMAIGAGLYIIGVGAAIALFVLLQFVKHPSEREGDPLSGVWSTAGTPPPFVSPPPGGTRKPSG